MSSATLHAGDESALRALNERYFNALDRLDFETMGDCFTEDTTAVYLGGDWQLRGRAAVVESIEAAVRSFESTIHAAATMSFAFGDDGPTGEVFAVAYIVVHDEAAKRLLVRGLRYRDRYVYERGQWRIARRVQDPLWQCEVDAMPPSIPAQR